MRVSCEFGDQDYVIDAHRYHVFLDGKRMRRVIMADEDNGLIEVFATNAAGHVIYIDGKPRKILMRGSVEIYIRPRKGAPPV